MLKVIEKSFEIKKNVLLFWNSQASVAGLKYLLQHYNSSVLLMLHGSDPHSIVSEITTYTCLRRERSL